MNPAIQPLLDTLKQRLQAHYGARLHKVILFGSQARGDYAADSDIDVLVVLADDLFNPYQEIHAVTPIVVDFTYLYPNLLSPIVISRRTFEEQQSVFVRQVAADGVAL